MFCMQCGAEIKDTAKFCSKCGNVVERNVNQLTNNNKVNPITTSKSASKKGFWKSIIVGVGFVALLFIVGGIGGVFFKNKEDLTKENDISLSKYQEETKMVNTTPMDPMDYKWLLVRTDTYDGEKNFLGCTTYEYSQTNKQIRWDMFNSDYSLNTRHEYTYDELDRIVHYQMSDGEGNLGESSERIYNGSYTQPTKVIWYKEDNTIKYYNQYTYHDVFEKTDIVWEMKANGDPVNYKEFQFDNDGNYTGYKFFYLDGTLYEKCIYTYDEAGNMIANDKYNGDDELKEHSEYVYEGSNEVSYKKWNGDGEITLWNKMEYDYAGNEIVRYYLDSEQKLQNIVVSVYEPIWNCDVTSIEHANGVYTYKSQNAVKELCLWFGQEKNNDVNLSEKNKISFPMKACITINETEKYYVEISSVMEKISFDDSLTVNSIKIEILDETEKIIRDSMLLPSIYTFI